MNDKDFQIERNILKIGNQIINQRTDDLKSYNLTSNQSETLLFFDQNRGAILLDLKEYLKISHQAARNIVERMKDKGLLYVAVSDTDGRARKVYLTEKGREICLKLKSRASYIGSNLLAGFTDQEKDQLAGFLDRILNNLW